MLEFQIIIYWHIPCFLYSKNVILFKTKGDHMKTFLMIFEDIWVIVAFAEADQYDALQTGEKQCRCNETVRLHAA